MDGILLALMPLLGFVAGTIGALIGAGGGFIAVPILLIVLPNETPGIITGMSQSMVLMTSLSSTVAYVRQKRIEYRWAGRDGRNGPRLEWPSARSSWSASIVANSRPSFGIAALAS